jgi:hypothetical protein
MKSIYFLLYFTQKGARHGVYAEAFARKIASLKNPKGLSSDQGDIPVINHLHVLVVLSSSRSTPENKKSSEKFQGMPKAPTKDKHLMSNPHEGAQTRRCTQHLQESRFPLLEEGQTRQDHRRSRPLRSSCKGDADPEVRARPFTS